MRERKVPEKTIERLPFYFRTLKVLQKEGEKFVTSEHFANKLPGVNSDTRQLRNKAVA